jgi:hypothetical protein
VVYEIDLLLLRLLRGQLRPISSRCGSKGAILAVKGSEG